MNVEKWGSQKEKVCQKGFTLLEVLIALAVFSVSSAALVLSDGQAIRQVSQVQNKVMASWLAEASLNQMYIAHSWPDTGTTGRVETLSGRQWYVQQEVLPSDIAHFRQVNVRIYASAQPKTIDEVYRLTGFIRRVKP